MNNSKLIPILKELNTKEWKRLEDLVRSPYFNKQKKCIEVFEFLKKGIVEQQAQYLHKDFIIQHLFTVTKNADNYFRVVIRLITQLVEEFLLQEKLKNQSYYKQHLLEGAFLDKELFGHYESAFRKSQKKGQASMSASTRRTSKRTYFEAYLQASNHSKFSQITKERNAKTTSSVENALKKLDQFYWVYRLALHIEVLSLKKVFNYEQEAFTLDQLSNIKHLLLDDSHQLLMIYHTAFLMLNIPETDVHFLKLEQLLHDNQTLVSKIELNNLYTLLSNHLIKKPQRNMQHFAKVFEIYQLMDELDILVTGKYMTLSKFKNVVTLGCLLKKFDWTLSFIHNNKKRLAPQHRESAYAFNLGFLHFFQQEFSLAQKYLLQVEPFDIFYTVDIKSLLIQIYFETQQWQAVELMLTPFKDFLRKQKKLNQRFKKGYLNFIKMLGLILKSRQKYGKQTGEQQKLLKKLETYEILHRKEWLRNKIILLETSFQ